MIKETNRLLFKPSDLVKTAECRHWSISVGQLPQLLSRLADDTGDIGVQTAAFYDHSRHLFLDVRVETILQLHCERCLERGSSRVLSESRLLVVRSDEQAAQQIDDFEAVITDEEGCLSLVDIVSDEILLALPAFYSHPSDECSVRLIDKFSDDFAIDERVHPFARLETMLSATE